MDIVELVKVDHASIRERIEDIGSEYTSPEGKVLFFRELARLVDTHSKAEEATILDFARNDADLRQHALRSLEEHVLTEELANRIRHTDDPEALEAKLNVYCNILAHHVDETEKQLLPLMDSRLDSADREEMGLRYEQLRSISLGRKQELAQDVAPEANLFSPLFNETGRIGFRPAWLLALPAWALAVAFLIRGH